MKLNKCPICRIRKLFYFIFHKLKLEITDSLTIEIENKMNNSKINILDCK